MSPEKVCHIHLHRIQSLAGHQSQIQLRNIYVLDRCISSRARARVNALKLFPVGLFSDTEGGENQVKDVVCRGFAGKFIVGLQSFIEVQQDHLMRHMGSRCGLGPQ